MGSKPALARQILEAQKECQGSGSCPEDLQRRLQAIVDQFDTAAEAALSYVKEEDPQYFRRFLQVIDRPFLLPYRQKTLQDLSKTPVGDDSSYDEETGDECLSRIMGAFVEESSGKKIEECNVTRSCWDMMTDKGRCKYSITHQLLYFSFIEKQGCTQRVEASMKAKVADTQERMCGSIYNEAASEVKDEKVDDVFQDLFLEQVLVCGTLGFENFMRSDWMRMVLTWQKPTGCFSEDNPLILQTVGRLVEAQEKERQLMEDLKMESAMIEQQHHNGRKLLRERVMHDGCLSHKTGLGVGTLGLYARYLVRQNFLGQ
ncbi:UPF0764 protein C16orf89 homolog [Babylonia areolata]|uniref:UPF0764 protein C16orf89 homolog n=1 Tax=Babylonia areolata TaxID=304850 RepID=UPI003FCF58B7